MKKILTLMSLMLLILPFFIMVSCHQNQTNNLFEVKQDGLYIIKKYYHGKMWNNQTLKQGKEITKDIMQIPFEGNGYDRPILELGQNDAIFLIFDNDDQDGLSPNDLLQEIYFNDSSIMQMPVVKTINQDLGNQIDNHNFDSTLIPFVKNNNKIINNKWFGSQNDQANDLSKQIKEFKQKYQSKPKLIESLQKFEPANIEYQSKNNTLHLKPLIIVDDVFSITKINDKTFKIQYHNHFQDNIFTFASFVLKNLQKQNYQYFGNFGIGNEKTWEKYHQNSNYKYIATYK